MTKIMVDENRCRKCGACVEACTLGVLSGETGEFPVVANEHICIECGRCMAKCTAEAVTVNGLPKRRFVPSAPAGLIGPADMELFLQSKRSCRKFKTKPVPDDLLLKLCDVAQIAPTSINSQEKTFIIVRDRHKIDEIRTAVVKRSKKIGSIIKIVPRAPIKYLLPRETAAYFKRLANDYGVMLSNAARGIDHLFFDAPCLVFFTGIGRDPAGKDNALNAMNYFMILAETMGLGTCINGFSVLFPKMLAKLVRVPRLYKIFAVATLGYRADDFPKIIFRKEPVIEWI